VRLVEVKLQNIVNDFKQSHQDSIQHGCKRDNCGIPASDFYYFCKKYNIDCPRIFGYFKVDRLKLSKKDFHIGELNLAKSKGYDINSNDDLKQFAEEIGIIDELYYMPHYWNVY
jgi:hypothetical protein